MHQMFLGKNRGEKHVKRSIDFIVQAIEAGIVKNLPDASEYPYAKWRKECELLQKLIQQARSLVRYSTYKTFKPLGVVYVQTTASNISSNFKPIHCITSFHTKILDK